MKKLRRWLWLALLIIPVALLGLGVWWSVFHLRPLVARALPDNDVLVCNADGYPVLEDYLDPSFRQRIDSYMWNRPRKTVWLDASCRPGRPVDGGEIRAISPTGDCLARLDRWGSRGDGSGAGSVVIEDRRGELTRAPAKSLPGDLFHDILLGKARSYPQLRVLDNRCTIVLGERSSLRDRQGRVLLSFDSNDYKTQFANFPCSDSRYVPLVHGPNLWTMDIPRFIIDAKYVLYDTLTGKEITLPQFPYNTQMVLVREDCFIYIPPSGQAVVVDRTSEKTRRLAASWSTWHVANGGETCWADEMRDKRHLAMLQWKTGKPTMRYTRIPKPAGDVIFTAALRDGGELAATAISRPVIAKASDKLTGRRTLTLYRHGRRAGVFTAPYNAETPFDAAGEHLAFSPDGRYLAWHFDRGDGRRSLYVFVVKQ